MPYDAHHDAQMFTIICASQAHEHPLEVGVLGNCVSEQPDGRGRGEPLAENDGLTDEIRVRDNRQRPPRRRAAGIITIGRRCRSSPPLSCQSLRNKHCDVSS